MLAEILIRSILRGAHLTQAVNPVPCALRLCKSPEQRELVTLQTMMTARLADKDKLIATLQKQITEPPNDPDAPVENDTGGT